MPADVNQPDFVRSVVQDAVYDARDAGRTISDAATEAQGKLHDLIYSDTSVNGRRLTWKELAQRQREELMQLDVYRRFVTDLDRCPHGRHEGDICSGERGCGGPSKGNMWMQDLLDREDSEDDREASLPRLGLGHSLDGYWSYFLRRPPKRGDLPIARLHVHKNGDERRVEIRELGDGL